MNTEEWIDGECKGNLGEVLVRYFLLNKLLNKLKIDATTFYILDRLQKNEKPLGVINILFDKNAQFILNM